MGQIIPHVSNLLYSILELCRQAAEKLRFHASPKGFRTAIGLADVVSESSIHIPLDG
jgi:hypothetical protein